MSDQVTKEIQAKVDKTIVLQREIESKISELKEAQDQITATWKTVERVMIDNDIKSVKGDWGSITIAERTTLKGDIDVVPAKFIKKAFDAKKAQAHKDLTGELPKGVTESTTKYLTKRIK